MVLILLENKELMNATAHVDVEEGSFKIENVCEDIDSVRERFHDYGEGAVFTLAAFIPDYVVKRDGMVVPYGDLTREEMDDYVDKHKTLVPSPLMIEMESFWEQKKINDIVDSLLDADTFAADAAATITDLKDSQSKAITELKLVAAAAKNCIGYSLNKIKEIEFDGKTLMGEDISKFKNILRSIKMDQNDVGSADIFFEDAKDLKYTITFVTGEKIHRENGNLSCIPAEEEK